MGIFFAATGLLAAAAAPATAADVKLLGPFKASPKPNPPGKGPVIMAKPMLKVVDKISPNVNPQMVGSSGNLWVPTPTPPNPKPSPPKGPILNNKMLDLSGKTWLPKSKFPNPGDNSNPKPPGNGSGKKPYNPFADPAFWAKQVENFSNSLGGHGHGGGYGGGYGRNPLPPNSLPSNTIPSTKPIRIVNPEASPGVVRFAVNDQIGALPPGEFAEIPRGPKWVIEFDRGGQFGKARYVLRSGIYRFELTDNGWDLYHEPGT